MCDHVGTRPSRQETWTPKLLGGQIADGSREEFACNLDILNHTTTLVAPFGPLVCQQTSAVTRGQRLHGTHRWI